MKLKYELECVDMGDEFIAVPIGDDSDIPKGVFKLNRSAYEVVNCLRDDTTIDCICETLAKSFERQGIRETVEHTIELLREHDLVED